MNQHNTEGKKLYRVDGVHGLFADAAVCDGGGELIFMSLWGRDTALQEFFARLSLPAQSGGSSAFNLTGTAGEGQMLVRISSPEGLGKFSGRMAGANLFGELAQTWIYSPLAMKPDHATRRAFRLYRNDRQPGGAAADGPLWDLLQSVSHLPLLGEWREAIVAVCQEQGWLKHHQGIATSAWEIDLGDPGYEQAVSELVKTGQLRLPGEAAPTGQGGEGDPGEPPARSGQRLTSRELENLLACFSGTENWYRHWLARLLYTDGVQAFAEHGGQQGAYWFLDLVATEFFPLLGKQPFLNIVLSVEGRRATVKVDDGNDRLLKEKAIEYTDMQEGDWRFYLTDNTLLLPGEY